LDYLLFSVIVLAVLALCLLLIRLPGQARLAGRPEELAERTRRRHQARKEAAARDQLPHQKFVLRRELKNVPTPWGWPGSDVRHGMGAGSAAGGQDFAGPSGTLQRWIERLRTEKRTVEDSDYQSRKDAALRTMLEDRYGRTPKPGEVVYQKVKPPRLADPTRPYDQLDNFPSGRTDSIVSGLDRQPERQTVEQVTNRARKAAIGEIRTPWGW
jgi:hypothetical protein